MATYSDGQRRALLNADLERGHLRPTDSAGNRVHGMTLRTLLRHGLIDRLWPPVPLTEFGAAEALRLQDAQDQGRARGSVPARATTSPRRTSDLRAMTADHEQFALAVDTPGATSEAFDVPSRELAIVEALRRIGRAAHLDDAGKPRITESIERKLGIVMASRVEGPNGASVFVADWVDAVGDLLLGETIDDSDQIDRTWLVTRWLTDHPEDDTSRGCDSKGQSKGRLGAYRVGRALKSFHELGIVVRAPSTVTVIDRTALAAFLETRRLAPSESQRSKSVSG